MKLAYMVATEEVSNPNVTALAGDTEKLFGMLKEVGYSGVELMIKNPFEINFNRIEQLLDKYDLKLAMLCTGEIYGEDNLSFGDQDQNVRKEAIRRAKYSMDVARRMNSRVNVGRLRGRFVDSIPRETTLGWIKDGFYEVCNYAKDVNLLIEPINKELANFILTTIDGLDFIESMKLPNLKLMVDLLHMYKEKEDITQNIIKVGNKKFGVIVDKLLGQDDIVIKSLGSLLTDVKEFSGGAILGDGSIALILDVASLI